MVDSQRLPLGGVLLYCPILTESPRVQLGEGALTGLREVVGGAESAAAHEQNKRTKRTFKLMGWNRNHKVKVLCRVEDTAHTPNFVPDLTQIWASRGCCSCCFWKYLYDVPAAVWLCAWAAVGSGSTRGGE